MSPRSRMQGPPRERAGFALVTAIFVLVALAGAAAALLALTGNQRNASLGEIEIARAYQAARSGIEWAAYHALRSGACPAATTLALDEAALRGFSVEVACTSTSHSDSAGVEHRFQIESSATRGSYGEAGYVRRRLTASFTDAA